MNLRNRSIPDTSASMEEEEVLLVQEEEEEEERGVGRKEEKKGVAGDERNIAVLLFLYILQVNT